MDNLALRQSAAAVARSQGRSSPVSTPSQCSSPTSSSSPTSAAAPAQQSKSTSNPTTAHKTTPSSSTLGPPANVYGASHRGKMMDTRSTSNPAKVPIVGRAPGAGVALSDTPLPTAPPSPSITPRRQVSADDYGRKHPTTLDIPGITKSRVSPDGKIADRDVGSKLVIIMVGLPARGKSYITKKLARYLNWLQHDTKIFNVGERRRVAASGGTRKSTEITDPEALRKAMRALERSWTVLGSPDSSKNRQTGPTSPASPFKDKAATPRSSTQILVNGEVEPSNVSPVAANIQQATSLLKPSASRNSAPVLANLQLPGSGYIETDPNRPVTATKLDMQEEEIVSPSQLISPVTPMTAYHVPTMPPPPPPRRRSVPKTEKSNNDFLEPDDTEGFDQSAAFFDPSNRRAALLREQCALDALDDLLNYILREGGSVGILDATNSTLERRKLIMRKIRERAGEDLNVLFVESQCVDPELLESNMRLKLSGPDYRDKDPQTSLADFKKRVAIYEKAYVPLGAYEEKHNMPYVQMIDVGRKVISHQVKGFLSAQVVYYLLNFNLAPRQIWICRHGQSVDNVIGRIGGDSDLSPYGIRFAAALAHFIAHERKLWTERQAQKAETTHMPPRPGDSTPPNPHYSTGEEDVYHHAFCVWTSMLKRSVETSAYFHEEDGFEVKQIRLLDELFAGTLEGLTYPEITSRFPQEYEARRRDKLHYRYPGPGGEGYLDVINRLRPVIVEVERMTDHVLLIGHRSVSRVLLAYFLGLPRDSVADLDVPLGTLYCLEPKTYGVDFKAFRYNNETESFDFLPGYELKRAESNINSYVEV